METFFSDGCFTGNLGDGLSNNGFFAGPEIPAGFLNNDCGIALPVHGGLTAAFSSNNTTDQLAALFLNENALGGSRDTSQPGIKVPLDARATYGMFQIHTQLAGSNAEDNPFQIDDANNVRCNPDAVSELFSPFSGWIYFDGPLCSHRKRKADKKMIGQDSKT